MNNERLTLYRKPTYKMYTSYGVIDYAEWCQKELSELETEDRACYINQTPTGRIAIFSTRKVKR